MEERDRELIARLINTDDELRQYWNEHLAFEQMLEEYNKRIYLTPEEELKRKKIQKLKLVGKDKIEEILARHR